jgi:hypothetical protein
MRFFAIAIIMLTFSCDKLEYSKISIRYDCLLSPCPLVKIENDSIYWIDQFSDKSIYANKFSLKRLNELLEKEKLDTLSKFYINNYADDGIQLNIDLIGKSQVRKIYVSNYYLPGVDSMIKLINQSLPDSLQLEYDSDFLIRTTNEGLKNGLIEINK